MPISIDFGTRMIHILSGEARKSGHIVLKDFRTIKVPAEILAESPVQQQRSIFVLIKPALDAMKIKRTACSFTLSDDRFLIRELKLPKASDNELRGMVRQEMISLYNADEDDIIELQVLSQLPDGMLSVRAAAFSRALADGFMKFAIDSKLIPKSLSYHSLNIGKLVSLKPEINNQRIEGKSIILADMGMFACIVHVVSDGKVVFSRYLPIGFSDLNYILTPRAGMDGADEHRGPMTATLDPKSEEYRAYSPYISEQVETFYYRLSDEISKMLRFLASSRVATQIEAIYLFGGSAHISGLEKRLSESVSISTQAVRTVSSITASGEIADKLPLLLNCAGSLI